MDESLLLLTGAALALSACVPAPAQDRAEGGCWVHAFGREAYQPPVTTFTGPTHERFLLEGVESLKVGPGARLDGYGRPGYEAQTLKLPPGTSIRSLEAMDFHSRVDSFQVVCDDADR